MSDKADIREIDAMIKINCAIPRKETMAMDISVLKKSHFEEKIRPTLERTISEEGILIFDAVQANKVNQFFN